MDHKVDISNMLDGLRPFVRRVAIIRNPTKRMFSACLRSSVVKTFEFLTVASTADSNEVFFLVPSLRSITEDIIVLRYISTLQSQLRDQAIQSMMISSVRAGIGLQSSFFQRHRRQQPVLNIPDDNSHSSAKTFWRNNGWPGLDREMPPVKELAKKCGPETLEFIYEYVFRLTSSSVHFSAQHLLRMGWGDSRSGKVTFDYRNMAPYFSTINLIYGSVLFCMYFKLFKRFLRPAVHEREAIERLRRKVDHEARWPEPVTFEEMNVRVPSLRHIIDELRHLAAGRFGVAAGDALAALLANEKDIERLAKVGDLVVGCTNAEELLRRGRGLLNGGS